MPAPPHLLAPAVAVLVLAVTGVISAPPQASEAAATAHNPTLNVRVSPTSNLAFTVAVDGVPWLDSAGATYLGELLVPTRPVSDCRGADRFGAFGCVAVVARAAGADIRLAVRWYPARNNMTVFSQTFLAATAVPSIAPTPAPLPNSTCSFISGADQTGGKLFARVANTSLAGCCAACTAHADCSCWARDPADGTCFLIHGCTGTRPRADRDVGFPAGQAPQPWPLDSLTASSAFPRFSTARPSAAQAPLLNVLLFGGSQLQTTRVERFNASLMYSPGDEGMPLVFYNAAAQALVAGPLDNFFVAMMGPEPTSTNDSTPAVGAGIKRSVSELPANFTHETVLLAAPTVTAGVHAYGDILLSISGKQRVDAYSDLLLSRLGYWTDNGAFTCLSCLFVPFSFFFW